MKLLLDQGIYYRTIRFLREMKIDVVTAAELDLSRAADLELLRVAHQTKRVLLTRDRDYGRLVFLNHIHVGVIYLRFSYVELEAGHKELIRVLQHYTIEQLMNAFVVVQSDKHRFRKLPYSS